MMLYKSWFGGSILINDFKFASETKLQDVCHILKIPVYNVHKGQG